MASTLLYTLLFIASVCFAAPPTAFQSNLLWTINGELYPAVMTYSLGQGKMSVEYLDGPEGLPERVDIYDFNGKKVYKTCALTDVCEVEVVAAGIVNLQLNVSGIADQGEATYKNVVCKVYSVPQPDNWTSTLYFDASTDLIVFANFSKVGDSWLMEFSNVTAVPDVSSPAVGSLLYTALNPPSICALAALVCLGDINVVVLVEDVSSLTDSIVEQVLGITGSLISSIPNADVSVVSYTLATADVNTKRSLDFTNALGSTLSDTTVSTITNSEDLPSAIVSAKNVLAPTSSVTNSYIVIFTYDLASDNSNFQSVVTQANLARSENITVFPVGLSGLVSASALATIGANVTWTQVVPSVSLNVTVEVILDTFCNAIFTPSCSCGNCDPPPAPAPPVTPPPFRPVVSLTTQQPYYATKPLTTGAVKQVAIVSQNTPPSKPITTAAIIAVILAGLVGLAIASVLIYQKMKAENVSFSDMGWKGQAHTSPLYQGTKEGINPLAE